jgi:hypothetical protein
MRAPINTIRLRHTLRCQHHHLPFSVLLAEEDDPFVSASRVLDESLCKLCGVPSRPDGNSEAARLWEQRDYLGSDSALTGEKPRDLLVNYPEREGASRARRVALSCWNEMGRNLNEGGWRVMGARQDDDQRFEKVLASLGRRQFAISCNLQSASIRFDGSRITHVSEG